MTSNAMVTGLHDIYFDFSFGLLDIYLDFFFKPVKLRAQTQLHAY
jgi:hypothetical protein